MKKIFQNIYFVLISRLVFFVIFQYLFYVIFLVLHSPNAFDEAANWWPYSVFLTNIISFILLNYNLKREGESYWTWFRFAKKTIGRDILVNILLLFLLMPIVFIGNQLLGEALFGNMQIAVDLFYRPLPYIAAIGAVIVFPFSQPFGEIPTYFGYVMPRLQKTLRNKLLGVLIPALFLSIQHIGFPLLFRLDFIVWRAFMFLPFALALGFILNWRPRLLPYILIGHLLINLMNAYMFLITASH